MDFVPKILLQVAVKDDLAGKVVEAIAESARTGKIGDGKIFVIPLEEAVRIRTGEKGNEAL
jgi:nitrogen regulatory protein P-II 1